MLLYRAINKTVILLIAFLLIQLSAFSGEYSFTKFDPPAQSSTVVLNPATGATETENFPRNNYRRFRGQDAELFTLEDVLGAFFGDESKVVASLLHSSISLMLQGKWMAYGERGVLMRKYLCGSEYQLIADKCKNLKVRKVGKRKRLRDAIANHVKSGLLSKRDADLKATELINATFFYEKDKRIIKRLIDYRAGGDAKNFSPDILFSSVFPRVASIYGDTILVIQERSDNYRSIDLGFYNGIKYKTIPDKYGSTDAWSKRADAGEYITPGFIKANELVGYHMHKRGQYPDKLRQGVRIFEYRVQQKMPIELAFYKYIFQGEVFVLVFDSTMSDGVTKSRCITLTDSGEIKHCQLAGYNYWLAYKSKFVMHGNQKVGAVTDQYASLMGIIRLVKMDENGERPSDTLFKKFNIHSSRSLSMNLKYSGIGHDDPATSVSNFTMDKDGSKYKAVYFLAK